MMLEGIIRWMTETPYCNPRHRMPPQYQELHKQQSTIGRDQMLYGRWSEQWRILQQQHLYNNNISCNPRNNDIGWITGHVTLIWNELLLLTHGLVSFKLLYGLCRYALSAFVPPSVIPNLQKNSWCGQAIKQICE
jgi:hypothetical protein